MNEGRRFVFPLGPSPEFFISMTFSAKPSWAIVPASWARRKIHPSAISMETIARSLARLILATREHILRHAYQLSERFRRAHGRLADHRCVLELSEYSLIEKARILYNHIYFSDLPRDYKQQLLEGGFYSRIVKHRNFNPRLVEWLSRFTNVRQSPAQDYQREVGRILENPSQLWHAAFRTANLRWLP